MNIPLPYAVGGLAVGMVLAGALGWALHIWQTNRRIGSAKARAQGLVDEAERAAEELKREARREADKEVRSQKEQSERELSRSRRAAGKLEQKLAKRESVLEQKIDQAEKREKDLSLLNLGDDGQSILLKVSENAVFGKLKKKYGIKGFNFTNVSVNFTKMVLDREYIDKKINSAHGLGSAHRPKIIYDGAFSDPTGRKYVPGGTPME